MARRQVTKIFFLAVFFFLAFFCELYLGSVKIPLKELFYLENRQILYLRFLRACLAAVVGFGLGGSGVVLQSLLRNPLADSYLLGTSSGAGVGAVLAVIFGMPYQLQPFLAFAGAWASFLIVYAVSRQGGRVSAQSIILSGVVVGMAASSLVVCAVSMWPSSSLHGIMWWMLGDLAVYDPGLLAISFSIVIAGMAVMFFFSRELNAISLGEEEAAHLGVETEKIKKILFFICALVTGAVVSVSGIIGFVGLIAPHAARLIFGSNHKVLLPGAVILSAGSLLLFDALAKTVLAPIEIPIGAVTGLIGAPVFIILLKNKQKAG